MDQIKRHIHLFKATLLIKVCTFLPCKSLVLLFTVISSNIQIREKYANFDEWAIHDIRPFSLKFFFAWTNKIWKSCLYKSIKLMLWPRALLHLCPPLFRHFLALFWPRYLHPYIQKKIYKYFWFCSILFYSNVLKAKELSCFEQS